MTGTDRDPSCSSTNPASAGFVLWGAQFVPSAFSIAATRSLLFGAVVLP